MEFTELKFVGIHDPLISSLLPSFTGKSHPHDLLKSLQDLADIHGLTLIMEIQVFVQFSWHDLTVRWQSGGRWLTCEMSPQSIGPGVNGSMKNS
jgi:hypothetical protein